MTLAETMKPYYADDLVTIYHGDCREWMPEADVIVTDPPYGTAHYATDTTVLTPALLAEWIGRYPRVAVFGYPERLATLVGGSEVIPTEWIVWWPTNGALRGTNLSGLWRETEHIAVFGKHHMNTLRRPRTGNGMHMARAAHRLEGRGEVRKRRPRAEPADEARMGDVWRDASPGLAHLSGARLHPNEKPLTLMSRLVVGMTTLADTVLDPFMGSGTTLVAAKSLNRKAIGIEIEERYCEIAARRCSQEVLGLTA